MSQSETDFRGIPCVESLSQFFVVTGIVFFGAVFIYNVQVARVDARQAALAEASRSAGESLIKEWDVPTPNSRPLDPAVAPDGALGYTGQLSNTLGRLAPATGEIREYHLKTPDSGPHGLVTSAPDRHGATVALE